MTTPIKVGGNMYDSHPGLRTGKLDGGIDDAVLGSLINGKVIHLTAKDNVILQSVNQYDTHITRRAYLGHLSPGNYMFLENLSCVDICSENICDDYDGDFYSEGIDGSTAGIQSDENNLFVRDISHPFCYFINFLSAPHSDDVSLSFTVCKNIVGYTYLTSTSEDLRTINSDTILELDSWDKARRVSSILSETTPIDLSVGETKTIISGDDLGAILTRKQYPDGIWLWLSMFGGAWKQTSINYSVTLRFASGGV